MCLSICVNTPVTSLYPCTKNLEWQTRSTSKKSEAAKSASSSSADSTDSKVKFPKNNYKQTRHLRFTWCRCHLSSRIPQWFYEDQMRAYFSQFGEITRLRMARNKRTGASKHYAYIEFRHEAVARIVAETMHNYLMFGRLIQCHLVPADKIHPETFVGANRKFKVIPWKKIAREAHNADETGEKAQARKERQLKHIKSVEERCKELGISWDSKDL